jgi:hypothetical protein
MESESDTGPYKNSAVSKNILEEDDLIVEHSRFRIFHTFLYIVINFAGLVDPGLSHGPVTLPPRLTELFSKANLCEDCNFICICILCTVKNIYSYTTRVGLTNEF